MFFYSKKNYQIAIGLLLIFSIFQYVLASSSVSKISIFLSFGSVLFALFLFFKYKRKENYLDFETIFVVLLLIVGYFYPIFLYNDFDPFVYFFGLEYDLRYINKATILFAIGIKSFLLGAVSNHEKKNSWSYLCGNISPNTLGFERAMRYNPENKNALKNLITKSERINTFYLSLGVLVLSVAFIITGGVGYFKNVYQNQGNIEFGMIGQIMSLLHAFAIVLIATEFRNKLLNKKYQINKIALGSIMIVVITMLYAGNRTFASYLFLPILILYAVYFRNIKLIPFIVVLLIGSFIMWTIQRFRAGYDISVSKDISVIFSDLIIPSRNNFVSLEYVDKYGFTYGKNMLNGIIGVIPSLERILVNVANINTRLLGSAELFTDYTFGSRATLGLGTTIIADIYLSFGLLGVVSLMFLIGYYGGYYYQRMLILEYYPLIIYSSLASFAVFWVRSTYTHPLKLIVWTITLAYLNKTLTQKR